MSSTARSDSRGHWTEHLSDDGVPYYFNSTTGESKWHLPDDVEILSENDNERSSIIPHSSTPSSGSKFNSSLRIVPPQMIEKMTNPLRKVDAISLTESDDDPKETLKNKNNKKLVHSSVNHMQYKANLRPRTIWGMEDLVRHTMGDAFFEQVSTPSVFATFSDDEGLIHGCEHYLLKCKSVASCCKETFPCRHCHDRVSDHTMDRTAVEEIYCMMCWRSQAPARHCFFCNVVFASYYCYKCKIWDDTPGRSIFHCEICETCKVGDVDTHIHDAQLLTDPELVESKIRADGYILKPGVVNPRDVTNIDVIILRAASIGDERRLRDILVEGHANNQARTIVGSYTALHFAAKSGHYDVCQVLLDAGWDPNCASELKINPLHYAASRGCRITCTVLLQGGANVNAQSSGLDTSLHRAAYYGHVAVCEELLIYGADVSISDSNGRIPIDVASSEAVRDILLHGPVDDSSSHSQFSIVT